MTQASPDHGRTAAPHTALILGGARSGKSTYAQSLAEASQRRLVYVATATAWDDEMVARVSAHRDGRDERWRTVEEPMNLAGALARETAPDTIVLVDCLTLWLTNVMLAGSDVEAETARLLTAVTRLDGPAIFVSNEVGAGIVPDNALARRFRDAQGRLNQAMAGICDSVVLVAAGLPLRLKPAAPVALSF